MKKLDSVEALAKAMGGLGHHFGKAASHLESLHKAHSALAKAHTAHAAAAEAAASTLDDGDVNKAFVASAHTFHKAAAAHHEEIATCCKAQAEHCVAVQAGMDGDETTKVTPIDTTKTAAAAPSGGDAISTMMEETKTALVKSAIQSLSTDDVIKEEIRKMVLAGVQAALSGQLVPTSVKGALPSVPGLGADGRPIPRDGGGPPIQLDSKGVDPEFASAFGA